MGDVAYTPNSRGGLLADRIAWTAGARTQAISLADDAEYGLAGKRQDGAAEATSRANMPFVGRFRANLEAADYDYAEFHVPMPSSVALTAWAIATNVFTATGAGSDDGLKVGQWVVIRPGSFASAPAAAIGVAVQITAVAAGTFSFAFTSGDDSATEAGTVKYQDVELVEDGGGGGTWTDADVDGSSCFFEKDGDLILRNRSGGTLSYALENIGTSNPNRVGSPDPNPRISELQGPITE